MCILQRARFASCSHFRIYPITANICPLANDSSLYPSSAIGPNGKVLIRTAPLPVTSGCFKSQLLSEDAGIITLPGLCVTCSYQDKHKVGGMTFRVGESVRNLSPKDLSEKRQLLHTLPLNIRFSRRGDLYKLGQRLSVNVKLDSEAKLAEIYNNYIQDKYEKLWGIQNLPKPNSEFEVACKILAESATKRLAMVAEAKYAKYLHKQQEEARESAKSRGLDILTIARKHRWKQLLEKEIDGALSTLLDMSIANHQLLEASPEESILEDATFSRGSTDENWDFVRRPSWEQGCVV